MDATPRFEVERISTTGTLTDRVCESLMQLVSNREFLAGSRLPAETQMAKAFGVSRTVIREAISRLKAEGRVESRQGSGVFVREANLKTPFRIDPTLADSAGAVLQVVELRMSLEGEAASLAALRRSPAQLTAIKTALRQIARDEQAGKDGVEADIAFHRSIAEATGNPHFLGLTEFLFTFLAAATRTTRHYEASSRVLSTQVKNEHQRIVDAIAKRDPELARSAAREHMAGATRRLGQAQRRQALGNSNHGDT